MKILLTGGLVYDGSGAPARNASVLIDGATIRAVGHIEALPDAQQVDCSGLAIAPGFIDVHSHSDLEVLEHRIEKVRQGVTTEIVGNCGFSLFPAIEGTDLVPSFDIFDRRGARIWPDAGILQELDAQVPVPTQLPYRACELAGQRDRNGSGEGGRREAGAYEVGIGGEPSSRARSDFYRFERSAQQLCRSG